MKRSFIPIVIIAVLLIGCEVETGPETPIDTGGDRLWVVDRPASQILVYKLDGTLLYEVGGFPEFIQPNGVDIYRADGSTWVIDFYADTLTKFDRYGNKLFQTTPPNDEEPTLRQPTSLAVNQNDGSVWVADYTHKRVVRFDESGVIKGTVTGFSYPRSVSIVESTGDCWVTDEGRDSIYLFDGDLAGEANVAAAGITVVGFDTPRVVKAIGDGGCWVLDIGKGELVHVGSNGAIIATVTGLGTPTSVAPSPVGDVLLVTDAFHGAVFAIDAEVTGTESLKSVGNVFVDGILNPAHISVDRDRGHVFITETGEDRVVEYDADTGEVVLEYGHLEGPIATALYFDRTD
jgi:DNA-binding beta-propeller fold protein YncE